PSSLDSFTNPVSSDTLSSPSHSAQHANANDAIEALQVKVGIDSSADTSSLEYRIAQLEAAGSPIVKVASFTASGTWTVPAGVTYAVAHIRGGGGGIAIDATDAGDGGSSSVAFASGTVTASGGSKAAVAGYSSNVIGPVPYAAKANSGHGAFGVNGKINSAAAGRAEDGAYIVAGADVTPAASITVTVGAGGAAGTAGAAGGSGYVWIEYQES
ncbi:MAG: hypothetical protein ACO3O3_14185, partial [Ilumatobacteraceae bacterium]